MENANKRIRRFLPGDTDLSNITQQQLVELAHHLNAQPRKCLGYKTPAEVFIAHLRESPTLQSGMMHLGWVLQQSAHQPLLIQTAAETSAARLTSAWPGSNHRSFTKHSESLRKRSTPA